jgi:two-component system sensor histidine kinase ChvG
VALVGIFIALPVILYGQFESADRQVRELVIRSSQDRSWLVGQAIRPLLMQAPLASPDALRNELRKYNANGGELKLLHQPAAAQGRQNFYYVASMPETSAGQLSGELDYLADQGILRRLSETCIWDAPAAIRYSRSDGQVEILTSLVPITTPAGCWVLVSTNATTEFLRTSLGRDYWQTREVRVAAVTYLIMVLVFVLIAVGIWRSLRRFREVAHEIRQGRFGEYAFSERNVVPELSSVARDFDRLVLELRRVARDMRQTAEDNAHSFKTPLATIQSALAPIRNRMPAGDERAARALAIIDSSVDRLKAMVNAAQHLEINNADLIDSPRRRIDLSQLVGAVLVDYREMLGARRMRLIRRIDDGIMVNAGDGMLEAILHNVLDNALSFSGAGSALFVTLAVEQGWADLRVEDEGPGIADDRLDRIFDRYFTTRLQTAERHASSGHAGLGLWIVRRNVEALGGKVVASNRKGGGLCVRVILPCSGGR